MSRTRKELNRLIETAYLIVRDDVDHIITGLIPSEHILHCTVDGKQIVLSYKDITDDDLIYGLQILNP